jgi:hypothetical protein
MQARCDPILRVQQIPLCKRFNVISFNALGRQTSITAYQQEPYYLGFIRKQARGRRPARIREVLVGYVALLKPAQALQISTESSVQMYSTTIQQLHSQY